MYACLMTKKSRIRSEMKFTLVLLIFYDVLILGIEMLFIFTEFVCLKKYLFFYFIDQSSKDAKKKFNTSM